MLSYSPAVITIARAIYHRNDKPNTKSEHVGNRTAVTPKFYSTRHDSTECAVQGTCTNTNHMNGHVVTDRRPVLGSGYQIVEAPPSAESRLKKDTMTPTPEASQVKTTVRFQKTVRVVPKSCDECRKFRDKCNGSGLLETGRVTPSRSQSTQTELPPVVSRGVPSLERSPSAPLPQVGLYASPIPILQRSGSTTGAIASWATRSRGSDSCSTDGGTMSSNTDSSFSIIATTPDPSTEYQLSAILIGDSGTGKTCLLTRLSENVFVENYDVTVGIDFSIARFALPDGRPIRMQLWDTAGQEKFRAITNSYYRKAMGVVMAYDVTRRDSLDSILNVWRQEVEKYADRDVILMLVGNKMDLDDDRTVTTRVGAKVANQLGALFFEVSAKENLNIQSAFQTFAKDILDNVYSRRNPCLSMDAMPINLSSRQERNVKTKKMKPGCIC